MKNLKLKNLNKKLICACLAATFAFAAPMTAALHAAPAAFSAVPMISSNDAADALALQVRNRPAPQRRGDLIIAGEIPRVVGNAELTLHFTAQFDEFVGAHRARALSVHFSTYVFTSDRFVSVVVNMEARGANSTQAVATTVIDAETMEIMTLTDFNPNALQLINNEIQRVAQNNPRNFVSVFSGVDDSHPFYLDGDMVRLPFASGTLFAASRGVQRMSFHISAIQNETIDSSMFDVLPADRYRTVMVDLAAVLGMFGFTAEFNEEDGEVNVYRARVHITTITIGENSYFYRDADDARSLEHAPRLENGVVQVPLSFFREILGIATTSFPPDYILMSRYDTSVVPGPVMPQNNSMLTE